MPSLPCDLVNESVITPTDALYLKQKYAHILNMALSCAPCACGARPGDGVRGWKREIWRHDLA